MSILSLCTNVGAIYPNSGRSKTKPTQHSVKELLSIGIQPDVLICRSDRMIPPNERAKIALFCNVPERAVISLKDVNSIYQIPAVKRRTKTHKDTDNFLFVTVGVTS